MGGELVSRISYYETNVYLFYAITFDK